MSSVLVIVVGVFAPLACVSIWLLVGIGRDTDKVTDDELRRSVATFPCRARISVGLGWNFARLYVLSDELLVRIPPFGFYRFGRRYSSLAPDRRGVKIERRNSDGSILEARVAALDNKAMWRVLTELGWVEADPG